MNQVTDCPQVPHLRNLESWSADECSEQTSASCQQVLFKTGILKADPMD